MERADRNKGDADDAYTLAACYRFERKRADQKTAEVEKLRALLRLVLPHIPPNAVDFEKMKTHRIDECYLNTLVREALTNQ